LNSMKLALRPRRSVLATLTLATMFGALAVQPVAAQTKITAGLSNTSADIAFYIAEKRGYFQAEGLEVSMEPFASAAKMIAPLGTGQLDVGGGTVAAGLYNAVERGINIKIVADRASISNEYEYSTLLVRKDLVDSGRYKDLKDLKGLTIAAAAQGAGSESSLNEALKKGGLKYSDVNVVYMGFPEQIAAYKNKGIDGGITNEPTVSRAIKGGFAVRASPNAIYPGQQTAVVLFSENFARQRDVAQKFMNAYIKALRDYNDALKDGKLAGPGAEEIVNIFTSSTTLKDADIVRNMVPFAVNPDGYINIETLKNDYAFFKERGLVGSKITVEQIVDNSFADEAVRVLGKYKPRH
jgi:NitT/TauT family transport system substrate-binding protein